MSRVVVVLLFGGFLVPGSLLAQDTEALDKPADIVREGLLKSAKQGGYVIKGNVDREDTGMGGILIGGMGGADIEGEFTAKIGENGTALFTLENDKGKLEVFSQDGRVANRQTWTGKQPKVGDFPKEIAALLNLKAIKRQVRNAKKMRNAGEKEIDGVDCTVVKGNFPVGLIEDAEEDEDEDQPFGIKMKLMETKKIGATFYVGKKDGLIKRISFEVTKGYSNAIRFGGMGEEDDEEEDDKEEGDEDEEEDDFGGPGGFNPRSIKFVTSYSFTVQKYDAGLKVEIPKSLSKFFEE